MELMVFNQEGKQTGAMNVSENVFGAEYNEALIHQVIVAQLANKRQGTKSALTRAEVRRRSQPYRQKGTGRARQGSIRAPQWRKGGVVFAPSPAIFPKNQQEDENRRVKERLKPKSSPRRILVLEETACRGKDKINGGNFKNLDIKGKTLIITNEHDETIMRAARNIEGVTITEARLLNVYDLVSNGKCIITKEAVKTLEEVNN